MADIETVAELAANTQAAFDKKFDEVKGLSDELKGKLDASDKGLKGLTERWDGTFKEFNEGVAELKARLDDAEQKLARKSTDQSTGFKSAGYRFIEDDGVKAFMADQRGGQRVTVEMDQKAIISGLTTVADGSAGDLVVPDRAPLIDGVERRMTVRDLITPGRTGSSSIQYPVETGFTNSAATISETAGGTKAQSDLQFDIRTASVTTIAHWVLATRQILDDAPMLQSYIDGRLRYGLRYAEEAQLLNGDGTGTNLNGVYTQATATTANLAVVASPTKLDVLRYAMLQASLAEYPASGIVIHPTDWAGIETTKDSAGNYIIGDPAATLQPRVWGLPVVATQAMTIDKYLVGAFKLGAQIFDRQDARVEVSTEDSDNFRKNLVTILAEERLALAVYRPTAFVKGDFSDQVTDLTS
jgi:HK97 family phage major capsid protein